MKRLVSRNILSVWVIVLVCLLNFPTLAQEVLSEHYTFESGATFSFPKAWRLNKNATPLTLVSDQTHVLILDYAALQAMGVDTSSASQQDILKTYFETTYPERTFKESKIETFEAGKRVGSQYDYSAENGRARVMVIAFTNGSAGLIEEQSLAGKLHEEDTVQAIVESFDNTEKVSGTTSSAPVSNKTVDCTVSTSRDDTVHVRVGPGENRSAIVFLSAGVSYKVLGQAKAKDGSKWWKLDKSEVAPDKAANEVWVKQDDVKPKGDCDKIVDVNAPPIVPIVNAPPANTESGAPPSGAAPASGSWVISYSNGKASCFGTGTIDVSVNQTSEVISVSLSGSTLRLGQNTLRSIGGSTYQGIGQITIDGQNVSTNITVQVVSTTQIVGSIVGTVNYGDTSCSVTYPFTVTKT